MRVDRQEEHMRWILASQNHCVFCSGLKQQMNTLWFVENWSLAVWRSMWDIPNPPIIHMRTQAIEGIDIRLHWCWYNTIHYHSDYIRFWKNLVFHWVVTRPHLLKRSSGIRVLLGLPVRSIGIIVEPLILNCWRTGGGGANSGVLHVVVLWSSWQTALHNVECMRSISWICFRQKCRTSVPKVAV